MGFSSGMITRKKSRSGPQPSMIAASSSSRGRRHEGPEEEHAERDAEGDLDQDQARQRLEQADGLQHPDRRHDRGRDDQAHEHRGIDDAVDPAGAPLEHEAHHRGHDHHPGHAGDREDRAVHHGGDEHVVPRREHLAEVLDQVERGGQGEVQGRRLLPVLHRVDDHQQERNHEHDHEENQRQGADHVDPDAVLHWSTSALRMK
ncbi:MAG: hypothetical protein ACTHUU_09450 [Brachybacterium sp.]